MKLRAETFQSSQLQQLSAALQPDVATWAAESRLMRDEGAHQPLRDIASLYAIYRARLARSRLGDFRRAVLTSGTMGGPRQELDGLTPREVGGRAAGQLAMANTVVTWYGLETDDIARLAGAQEQEEVFAGMLVIGLEEAVCNAPRQLDIVTFTPADRYHETVPDAVAAVSVLGSDALDPYVAFPVYPVLMDIAA